MFCPDCRVTVGRFRVTADTTQLVDTVTCSRTGAQHILQQDIEQQTMPSAKTEQREPRAPTSSSPKQPQHPASTPAAAASKLAARPDGLFLARRRGYRRLSVELAAAVSWLYHARYRRTMGRSCSTRH
jgi:hypothetical protein